ncbi:MAG TPA: sulfatase-like hydrolase/transferase [Kofleriaceae bacterium]
MRSLLALVVTVAACGSDKKPELPTSVPSSPVAHEAAAPSDAAAANDAPAVDAATADARADATRPEHVVYDLVDNRHAAHRMVNGDLVLDGGDIGFARYTLLGAPAWKLGQVVDGRRAAVPGAPASLEVPLTVEQARTSVQLEMSVHAAADLTLSLNVNDGKSSKRLRVPIGAGWSVVTLPIDPKLLAVGENELSIEWKRKGKAPKDETTFAIEWIRIGKAVPLPPLHVPVPLHDPRSATTWDVTKHAIALDQNAMLTWFVTLPDGANVVASVDAPCVIDVRARPSADAFAGGVLDATHDRVDLTQMAGRTVALTLLAHDCPRATITRPRITVHGAEPVRLPTAPPPKYVVLWEMDGVRADSLAAFMNGRASTPTIDELAKTSTVYRQIYSRGQQSLLAGDKVPDFAAIAKPMQDAGYTAAAVTGAGPSLADEAIRQLDALRAKPAYLVVGATHTMVCPADPDPSHLRELYDASLSAPDEDLGRFIKQLRTWGIWDQTMLVVVSNHGEELFENGRCGFGHTLLDSEVHVPLLIHDPSRFPTGAVEEGADATAVFPTMLAAATGHDAPLIALAQGAGRGWARPSFAMNTELRVMRIGAWKLSIENNGIAWISNVGSGSFESAAQKLDAYPVELRMLVDNLTLYLAAKTSFDTSGVVVTQVTPAGAAALDSASTP